MLTNIITSTVCVGRISSHFGSRCHPLTGSRSYHNGVDVALPIGTPVRSPGDGVVSMVTTHPSGGLSLAIIHQGLVRTGYAHLCTVCVSEGDTVRAGQVIAYSGNSGKSTGPHLHLTLQSPIGQWVNPSCLVEPLHL